MNWIARTLLIACFSVVAALNAFAQQNEVSDTVLVQQAEKNLAQIAAFEDDNQTSLVNLTSSLPVTADTLDQAIAELSNQSVSKAQLTLTDATLEKIRAFIRTREDDLVRLETQAEKVEVTFAALNRARQIEQNPLAKKPPMMDLSMLDKLIAQATSLTSILNAREETYQNELDQAQQLLGLTEKWQSALVGAFQAQASQNQKTDRSLVNQQKNYQEKATKFRKQLENNRAQLSIEQQQHLQMGLYHYDDLAWLTRVDQTLANVLFDQSLLLAQNDKLLNELPLPALQDLATSLGNLENTLNQNKMAVDARDVVYQNRRSVIPHQPFPEDLASAFSKRQAQIDAQLTMLNPILTRVEAQVQQKAHAVLFENDRFYVTLAEEQTDFPEFTRALSTSPIQFALQGKIALSSLFDSMKVNLWAKIGKIVLAIFAIIFVIAMIYRYTHQQLVIYRVKDEADNDDNRFTTEPEIISRFNFLKKTRFLLYVLDANWVNFSIALSAQAMIYLSAVSSPSLELLSIAVAVISTGFLWISLVNLSVSTQGFPENAARTCRRLGLVFAVAILFYVSAKLISTHALVVQFFEKILFIVGIPTLFKLRQLINYLLTKRQDDDFLYRIFKWWLRLTPWVLMICMFIGLIGYSNLAWLTAKRASIVALVILMMFIGFEALQDLKRWLKLMCIRHVKNGAFVAQDVVSPALTILKLLWVGGCGLFVLMLFDWHAGTPVISHALAIINYPLVKLGNVSINIRNLVLTALIAYAVFQVGRWFKSVSYRWLFSHLNDLSIRNSLSIFGQYVVVTASFLIGLQMIGIDLTAFAVFAGALGVGIGLGLQNIAKNFISGLLLLAERPLRTGDTVTIDTAEGEVQRIGMRSITLKTFSSEEVIVPNADVIEKSFKNWTYSDQKLRTELYIGASYDARPDSVLAILNEIMNAHPNLCEDPAPMAILWSYDDSAITYRIQYHVDLGKHSLFATRTEILSAVWDEFNANDISIPYPQQDITIKREKHKQSPASEQHKRSTRDVASLADDRLDSHSDDGEAD